MASFPDIATLFLFGALGGLSVAVILTVSWFGDRSQRYIILWAGSYLLYGLAGLLLALRGRIPDVLSVVAAWPVYYLALASTWLSFRAFANRRQSNDIFYMLLGTIVWLLFALTGPLFDNMNNRVIVQTAIVTAYSFAAAYEIWCLFRSEPLPSAPILIVLYGFHSLVQAARCVGTIVAPPPLPESTALVSSPLMGAIVAESVLVILLSGMAQMTLMGQRKERAYRIAAQTDEMTGISNRRFFLEQAVPGVTRSREGALIVLDLDHFKAINDTYGHAAGDVVLMAVTSTISRFITPPSIFGRIGGEEFAIFMPNLDGPAAVAFAERLRHAVDALRINFREHLLRITVSCGVAGVAEAERHYDRLHRNADAALYDAKAAGRNRVVAHVDTGRLWRELRDGGAQRTDSAAAGASVS